MFVRVNVINDNKNKMLNKNGHSFYRILGCKNSDVC